MAQELKSFTFPARVGTGESHDWDKWLNGKIWKLTAGTDYKCKDQTIRMMAYKHAKKVGITVQVAKWHEQDKEGKEVEGGKHGVVIKAGELIEDDKK